MKRKPPGGKRRSDEPSVEPSSDLRKRALALYKPPFRFDGISYIWDAEREVVADDKTDKTDAPVNVRGWGRIGYLPNAKELHTEVGRLIAEALTEFWERHSPLRKPVDEVKACILGAIASGCDREDAITRFVEEFKEVVGIDDDRMIHNVLFEMVERDHTLTWHLPPGVAEDSPEAGSTPLLYKRVSP